MEFYRRSISMVSLALMITFSGCAAFRAGNTPRYPSVPEAGMAKRKSVKVNFFGTVIVNNEIYQAPHGATEAWREQTVKAYEESDLFLEVKDKANESDLHAEVLVVLKKDPNAFFAFITGLTLYLIPSKATDEFTVKTMITDRDGTTLGTFERRETVTLWQHLLMVLAMPFNWRSSVTREVLHDLNRATIEDAHAEGVF
jgi:hypothetical protein